MDITTLDRLRGEKERSILSGLQRVRDRAIAVQYYDATLGNPDALARELGLLRRVSMQGLKSSVQRFFAGQRLVVHAVPVERSRP